MWPRGSPPSEPNVTFFLNLGFWQSKSKRGRCLGYDRSVNPQRGGAGGGQRVPDRGLVFITEDGAASTAELRQPLEGDRDLVQGMAKGDEALRAISASGPDYLLGNLSRYILPQSW